MRNFHRKRSLKLIIAGAQRAKSARRLGPVLYRAAFIAGLGLYAAFSMNLGTVEARSQWEIQHPTLPADQDSTYLPGQMPGQLHTGVPAQLNKNFWQGGQFPSLMNRVQPGIILTGTLDKELSSAKNKPGDIFAITLKDGYVANGLQVIPQNSKIVGAVTAVAKTMSRGQPGNLQVTLQSLVLPDGTHLPFAGFISANPNHTYKKAPKQRQGGFDLKDSGQMVSGMFSNYTNGIGYLVSKRLRGNDFKVDKDDLLPVRLNQALVIPEQEIHPVAQAIVPAGMPGAPGAPPMVPGLTGPGYRRSISTGTNRAAQAVPGLVGESDPFNAPVNPSAQSRPLSEMPEPF